MPGVSINGNDIELMAKTTREAANRARAGEGPTFIEAQTYRFKGHSMSDPAKYRTQGRARRGAKERPDRRLPERAQGARLDRRRGDRADRRRGQGTRSRRASSSPRRATEPPARRALSGHHRGPLHPAGVTDGRACLPRSPEPGDDRGDGARRPRLPDGRRGRRVRRRLQGQPGDARAVRRPPGHRHADLRGGLRRHRASAPRWSGCGRSSSS